MLIHGARIRMHDRWFDFGIAILRAHAFGCWRIFQHTFLYSHLHSVEVAAHAICLGEEYGLSTRDIAMLRASAECHDIGKIPLLVTMLSVEDMVIAQDSPEMDIIRQHAIIGADSVEAISIAVPLVADIAYEVGKVVRHHHERYDGTGYPDGIAGTRIPLLSRMLCITDSAKAMSTPERRWRRPLTVHEMLAEIHRNAGTQFDPELAEMYCRLIESNAIRMPR